MIHIDRKAVILFFTIGVFLILIKLYSQRYNGNSEIYAIQNVATGMMLRPKDAQKEDNTKIVTYERHNWKCLKWIFHRTGKNSYRLENRFTSKSIQPLSGPENCLTVVQKPLSDSDEQEWEFLEQKDGTFMIRKKNSIYYITAAADSRSLQNPVRLLPKQDNRMQRWQLKAQNPLF